MKTLLLADDDRTVREVCRRFLEDEGYRVVLACDGEEAISLLHSERPDMAILDIHMPHVNGLEAAEHISRSGRGIPVILFTAYDDACVHDGRAQLAAACVEKSLDLTELKRAILRILAPCKAEGSFSLGLPPAGPLPHGDATVR
jgi:CheY-like chemotaxis protein